MAQKLGEEQLVEQVQQLSTLQVAIAKLVELPITELATRVKDEMLDNAALEEADSESDYNLAGREDTAHEESEEQSEEDIEPDVYTMEERDDYGSENDAMSDYLTTDDVPEYLLRRAGEERDRTEFQYAAADSFYESLLKQVAEYDLSNHEKEVLNYLIGSLDADGFLRKSFAVLADEMELYQDIHTDEEELSRLLAVLQKFEPSGVGARDLKECLRLQLLATEEPTAYTRTALAVIERCYNDFINKRWDTVKQRLHLDDEAFEHVKAEITRLNPMPGSALGESTTAASQTIIPDFYVRATNDGELRVEINNGDVPELRISPAFRDSIRQYSGRHKQLTQEQLDAYTYARRKVESAQVFINLIERRNQTLRLVMEEITRRQRAFFLGDDDETLLVPLNLKEVADHIGISLSTVSRVTGSKYVETLYGTYPLRFFFSFRFTASDGEEQSSRTIRYALAELIDNEDKHHPLTDEKLAEMLCARGLNVARRTVAKYREMLGKPTARLRKN